jgi:hypothetical protein
MISPSTTEPAAPRRYPIASLLRTHGVVEEATVEAKAIGTVVSHVRGLLRRLLLRAGLRFLSRSCRDFIVVISLDVLLYEQSRGQ